MWRSLQAVLYAFETLIERLHMIHFMKLYWFFQLVSDVYSCLFCALTRSKEEEMICLNWGTTAVCHGTLKWYLGYCLNFVIKLTKFVSWYFISYLKYPAVSCLSVHVLFAPWCFFTVWEYGHVAECVRVGSPAGWIRSVQCRIPGYERQGQNDLNAKEPLRLSLR